MSLSVETFHVGIVMDPERNLEVINDPEGKRLRLCLVEPHWGPRCEVIVYLIIHNLIWHLEEVCSNNTSHKFNEFCSIDHENGGHSDSIEPNTLLRDPQEGIDLQCFCNREPHTVEKLLKYG